MKRGLMWVAVCLIVAIGSGCGDDDGGSSPKPGLVGTWTRSSSTLFTLTFGTNTYEGKFTGGPQIDVSGNYSTSDSTITLTDNGGPMACADHGNFITATYTFTISGNTLTFSNPSDSCTARDSILTGGPWTRQ